MSRFLVKTNFQLAVLLFVLVSAGSIFAQQNADGKGVELYQKGDFQNAILNLKDSAEVKDLYYLGLAYEKVNALNEAKEAYNKTLKTGYDIYFKSFDEWQKAENFETNKPFSELLQQLKPNNEFGLQAAERAYKLKSKIFQTNEWIIKAGVLADAVKLVQTQEKIHFSSDKSIAPLIIIEKPRASFPKDLSGTPIIPRDMRVNKAEIIIVFVVFGADGEIKMLMPIQKSFNSLTAATIAAARNIKYKAATKDNKPVTVHSKIQYSFSFG